jgi:4-hydroxybenzoyl-CoA reductase subunit beta
MLRLPPFELFPATTLDEALARLAEDPAGTRVVAGGTDLWPNMKRGLQGAKRIVSLSRVPGLSLVQGSPTSGLRIGAMITLHRLSQEPTIVANYPTLAKAARSVSSPTLRRMGTLGGNLCVDTRCTYYNQSELWRSAIDNCLKERGNTCWVAPNSDRCWAISSSDLAPHLCAIDARVVLASPRGERTMALTELYRNDGIDYLTKAPDEIVKELLLPPAATWRSAFFKLRRRGCIDFSVLTAAPAIRLAQDGIVQEARVFLGAISSAPVLAENASKHLEDHRLDDTRIAEAAALSRKAATPFDNADFSPAWRGKMIAKAVADTLHAIRAGTFSP